MLRNTTTINYDYTTSSLFEGNHLRISCGLSRHLYSIYPPCYTMTKSSSSFSPYYVHTGRWLTLAYPLWSKSLYCHAILMIGASLKKNDPCIQNIIFAVNQNDTTLQNITSCVHSQIVSGWDYPNTHSRKLIH
jgi:hypothetical protein